MCGIGISYQDVKNLFATWAKFDATMGSAPPEIANDLPAVVVMDNDDFKTDSLTGTSDSNHRTNVMFVQSEDRIKQITPTIKPKLISSNDMSDLVKELIHVTPYKTNKVGNPAVREPFDIELDCARDIRCDEIIHSLIHIKDNTQSIRHEDQTNGSLAGFQLLLNDEVTKSKPYYWLTFPKPPHKSVTHKIMNRFLKVIDEKKYAIPYTYW